MDDQRIYTAGQQYYKEFGPIVRIDLPGQSPNVWLFDPHAMLKVFRSEGAYPDGLIRLTWPIEKHNSRRPVPSALFTVGKPWKELRNKLNPGIFNIKAANGFVPSNLNPTAADLSAHFPEQAGDLTAFCTRSSFDLFCSGMLGKSLRVISEKDADPRDVALADSAARFFELFGDLLYSPFESAMKDRIDTNVFKEFEGLWYSKFARTEQIIADCQADASIQHSYLKALLESGEFSVEEATHEMINLLGAGVDSTAATLVWLLYDLARNPKAQATAAAEVRAELAPNGEFRTDAKLPYVQACYRESIRLSPIGQTGTFRTTPVDLELKGYHIPKGTRVTMMGVPMMMDPEIVTEPHKFKPERWLPEAVAERKGTSRQIHDHKLLGATFGFGPRMCIGARFAKNMIFALTTRILHDWEMTVKVPHEKIEMRLIRMPKPSPQLKLTPRN